MLIKDPSEISSLEYLKVTNYTVSFFYYADMCFCVLIDQHFSTELCKKKYCKKRLEAIVGVYMCSLK